jgi:phage head maturation protease
MDKMSFGVFPAKWKDARQDDGSVVRTHTAATLYDISPVAMPAFEGTKAQLHDQAGDNRRELMARARVRVTQEVYK